MTDEEPSSWTRRIVHLPFYKALAMIAQQYVLTGDATLIGFHSPKNLSEWEFNSRVDTLQSTFDKFERAKLSRDSTAALS